MREIIKAVLFFFYTILYFIHSVVEGWKGRKMNKLEMMVRKIDVKTVSSHPEGK